MLVAYPQILICKKVLPDPFALGNEWMVLFAGVVVSTAFFKGGCILVSHL